ncbi:MAG: hypothetical protein NT080_10785 [Spirochaetes bacterium]|nr:hypothetical protein [Spirochaetota bacterium]
MAQIKSALELALERTKDLKPNLASIETNELRQEGKRLAGEFLRNPETVDLAKAIRTCAKDRVGRIREGAFEVLATRIQLPLSRNTDTEGTFQILARGFSALNTALLGEKRIEAMFQQIAEFMKRYAEDIATMDASIRKQYEPKLKRKEQEYAARTGQAVRIDPMSDPEFVAFYQQNAGQVKTQYQAALDRAKEELAATLGIKGKGED